jgi:hypothetical protein
VKLPGLFAALVRRDGRWPRLLVVLACAVIVVMFARNEDMGGDAKTPRGDGVYRPVLARGDGHMIYLMARSTALDGDWDFANDLKRFGDPWVEPVSKKTGRKEIVHPIGAALVWTPLIWIAEGAAVIANVFGAGIPLHAYTEWHQRFVFLSSALFACASVLLGRWLARKLGLGRWATSYAATGILLGTSLTYYATFMPSYTHAMDAFACAMFLAYWAATLGRLDVRRWIVLGVLLGLAALIRVQELALGVVVVVEVIARGSRARTRDDWREVARLVAGGALVLALALITFIPQLAEWQIVFGSMTALPQGAQYTRMNAPMIMELLYSSRNGWLLATPIVSLALVGLFCIPRRHRVIAIGLGAFVVIQVYLNSTILDWWGGSSFGQRRLCNVTLPLVVGLAALVGAAGRLVARRHIALRTAAHVLIVVIFGGFIAWNVHRARELKGGKGAPGERVTSCCTNVPLRFRGTAQWIYDRIGNPFQLPASAIFAWRHDVPIQRWDEVAGDYPLIPSFGDVRRDAIWGTRGIWRFGSPNLTPYAIRGWSANYQRERLYRYTLTREAVFLVPNLMPVAQRMSLWIAADRRKEVTIAWNGRVVARATVDTDWSPVTFYVPGDLHTNELSVRASVDLFGGNPRLQHPGRPVGVAVSDLDIELVPP